jgi:copper chaperone CopZ
MDATEFQGMVASSIPGRVRIRLHPAARANGAVHRVKEHIAKQVGITRVAANPTTGSLVVHYDQSVTSLEDIIGVCADIGVIVGSFAGLDLDEASTTGTVTSRGIMEVVDRIDRRLSHATGRKVDLRLLFPAALFAVGLRQVIVEGFGLTRIPGYVLLWYAFDSFWKLHQVPRRTDVSVEPSTTGAPPSGSRTP